MKLEDVISELGTLYLKLGNAEVMVQNTDRHSAAVSPLITINTWDHEHVATHPIVVLVPRK